MLDILFWIAVGAFVGWNLPQPVWAKIIQEKIQAIIAKRGS
jgi:polyferredoxin